MNAHLANAATVRITARTMTIFTTASCPPPVPGRQHRRARSSGVQAGFGSQFGACPAHVLDREVRERLVALGDQGQEKGRLGLGAAAGRAAPADDRFARGRRHGGLSGAGKGRAGKQREDVRLGRGADDRAGVVQDDVREQRGLVGPRRCHQQQVFFQHAEQRERLAAADAREQAHHEALTGRLNELSRLVQVAVRDEAPILATVKCLEEAVATLAAKLAEVVPQDGPARVYKLSPTP